jgi:hypothetical protein
MRFKGHVARMGEEKKCIRFWCESPKERDSWKTEAKVGGWDQNGSYGDWLGVYSGSSWFRMGTGDGLL